MSEEDGLRVVVVNPREKPKRKGTKKMAKKKTKKKTTRTARSNPAPKHKRRSYHKRRNPGFGFSGRNLAYGAGGAAGAVAADLGVSMIGLSPMISGGIELAGGAALSALLDHKLAQAAGAVLMAMGGWKVANALMAKPAGVTPKAAAEARPAGALRRPGLRGVVDGMGDFEGYGDDGVGEVGDFDAVGELEEGMGDFDGVGEVGDVDAVGEVDGYGEDTGGGWGLGEYEAA